MNEPNGRPARPWADECDLILKGGITSGVVYPLAICELAKAFRLRSIGGTSAGAIAAAAAAAAECGRQRRVFENDPLPHCRDGFGLLAKLPKYLGERTRDSATRLIGFFQPSARLKPLFDCFLIALGKGPKWWRAVRIIFRLAFALGVWPLTVGLLAMTPAYVIWRSGAPWFTYTPFAVVAAIATLATLTWCVYRRVVTALPENDFGFCTGKGGSTPEGGPQALTDWLADYLEVLSGQKHIDPDRPLTFGDLRQHGVDLQMMTTCLTLGRPFRLPFRDDELVKENKSFWWRRTDFEGLFPERIVKWMEDHQRPPGQFRSIAKDSHDSSFLRLPVPDDMPVVVAVRMSLSFPVLLSAVRLYAFDDLMPAAGRTREPVWFTDGGVASNFPVHFFDAPLPSRPTFGIDLGHSKDDSDHGVYMPRTNNDARYSDWRRLADGIDRQLMSFLSMIFGVAKEWNHESLSHLPGFRDRIALVRLKDEEGGLNLNMSDDLISRLSYFGEQAGRRFVRRFGNPDRWSVEVPSSESGQIELDWTNHQNVRLRSFLTTTAEHVGLLELVRAKLDGTPADYERFLQPGAPESSYRLEGVNKPRASGLPGSQADLARELMERLRDLTGVLDASVAAAQANGRDIRLVKGTPRPPPELKIRPRV